MLSRTTLSALLLSFAAIGLTCVREHTPLSYGRAHRHAHQALKKRQEGSAFPPVLDENERVLIDSFDATDIDTYSYYYTHGDHIAGRNRSMAQWTADRWAENGFDTYIAAYNVYLNYPVSHSLSMTGSNGSTYTATLEEDVLEEDSVTSYPDRIPTFHGYSATGSATAEFVYVGRGQRVDFERLVELGVELEGKIALSRYGGAFRGLKVKNAQDYGMIGAVLFTDPADDGNVTEFNGYDTYPDGPARNPSSVQRGSVLYLSTFPGDPTTPGYPSREDSPRADIAPVTPQIPSIPISWVEAQPLLQALNGFGASGEEVNRTVWTGAIPDVDYSTGPAPGVTISMENVMEDAYEDVWNPIGIINGTESDEVIVIGNHRDAWIIGGAADPNSGSAIMVELSKAFGELMATGWKPRRTIVLCSWDAEEYGLVGSTEWVEEYIPWLTTSAVTYLNIDVGSSGPNPDMTAVPELHAIGQDSMKKVVYPYRGQDGLTLYDVWYNLTEGEVGVLGSGSDYTAFLHKGIASLDMGSGAGPEDPIYHYHSNYDSYAWMAGFGDPGFVTHRVMGEWLTLLAYHLANDAIIPFDLSAYESELEIYLDDLTETLASSEVEGAAELDITPVREAVDNFLAMAQMATEFAASAADSGNDEAIQRANANFRDFHRGFTSQGGLPTREFYQHVLFAPGLDTGYAPVTFPGITEAIIEYRNVTMAEEWVVRTAAGIDVAAGILQP